VALNVCYVRNGQISVSRLIAPSVTFSPVAALDLSKRVHSLPCPMKYHRLLAISVVAALITVVAPVFSQEGVETASSPESIEPKPLVERSSDGALAPRKGSKPNVQEKPARDLQDSMTAEQFKAAGLDKLSPEELKTLNASLKGSRQEAEKKAVEKATVEITKKAAAESHAKMDEILSRVDGDFGGITGHTIIKLEDGTKWKQVNVDDRYKARVTYHPPVKVWHSAFGYRMRVVGTGEFYVDPVRERR
jgi:hypothetical protein